MAEKYFATVEYPKDKKPNNTERSTLQHFATLYCGRELPSSSNSRYIGFIFGEEQKAQDFGSIAQRLEKIVKVTVGKVR